MSTFLHSEIKVFCAAAVRPEYGVLNFLSKSVNEVILDDGHSITSDVHGVWKMPVPFCFLITVRD
jgi:hypothetical protein